MLMVCKCVSHHLKVNKPIAPVFLQRLWIVNELEWHLIIYHIPNLSMPSNNDICCYGKEADWKSNLPTLIVLDFPFGIKVAMFDLKRLLDHDHKQDWMGCIQRLKDSKFWLENQEHKWRAFPADFKSHWSKEALILHFVMLFDRTYSPKSDLYCITVPSQWTFNNHT